MAWETRIYVKRHDDTLEAMWRAQGIGYTGFGVTDNGHCWYRIRYDRRDEAMRIYRNGWSGNRDRRS